MLASLWNFSSDNPVTNFIANYGGRAIYNFLADNGGRAIYNFLADNGGRTAAKTVADYGGRATVNFVQQNEPLVVAGAVGVVTAYVAHRKGYLHMPNLQMPNRPVFLGGKPAPVQTPTDTSASSSRANEGEVGKGDERRRSRSPSPRLGGSGNDE
ncbi:MAG: hypothetical protein AB7V32_04425 [Candidatus Berkiella sp.]